MRKVYFIYEDCEPFTVNGKFTQIVTGYGVTSGYIKEEHEVDLYCEDSHVRIYACDNPETCEEFENYIPGAYFETHNDAAKKLTKILAVRCGHDKEIKKTFITLIDEHPEFVI